MPCHYCEKHLNLLLLSSANVRTIELKRSEQKHVTAAFQHKIFIFTTSRTKSVRLSVLQDILSISVLLIQRQQKFQMTLFFFYLLPPNSRISGFQPEIVSLSRACRAPSLHCRMRDPLALLPGYRLALVSPLMHRLAGGTPTNPAAG